MKNSHKFDGLLIFRSNIKNPTIVNIRAEIVVLILECNILLKTIHLINKQQWQKFDGLAGDQKCQTRASMILDYIPLLTANTSQLQYIKNQITETLQKLKALTLNYQKNNYKFISYYKKNIQFKSLQAFFQNLHIKIKIPEQLKFFALSIITTLKQENFKELTLAEISNKQIEKIISAAKMLLCELSVKYEQNLSKKYGNKEEQALLQIIGYKQYACGQSIMTAFAPSFTVVLKKNGKT